MSEQFVFKDSSNIKAATWDELTHNLTIDFHHGKPYPPVKNVPESTWRAFKASDSPGAFVNSHFRGK